MDKPTDNPCSGSALKFPRSSIESQSGESCHIEMDTFGSNKNTSVQVDDCKDPGKNDLV